MAGWAGGPGSILGWLGLKLGGRPNAWQPVPGQPVPGQAVRGRAPQPVPVTIGRRPVPAPPDRACDVNPLAGFAAGGAR